MKGFGFASALACALLCALSPATPASQSAARIEPQHAKRARAGEGLHFETAKPHSERDSIGLGDVYYGPAPEAAPDLRPGGAPEIVVIAPGYAPTIQPAEAPSAGPRIIYVGKETSRQNSGSIPRVFYGDLPSRAVNGPQVLYGK